MSLSLHSLVLGVIAAEVLMVGLAMPIAQPVDPLYQQSVPFDAEPTELVELRPYTAPAAPWMTGEAADLGVIAATLEDPRWAMLSEGEPDEQTPAARAAASDFLAARVMEAVEVAEQQADAANLDRLAELTGELNNVSTEQSVKEVTAQVSKLLGTAARATEPAAEAVPGEFDFETAQLHDVVRTMLDDGSFQYTAVLIDAAGRTINSDMTAAEGESAYQTFELIKSNPLLERVYRGVVMSFLDKLLKPAP